MLGAFVGVNCDVPSGVKEQRPCRYCSKHADLNDFIERGYF